MGSFFSLGSSCRIVVHPFWAFGLLWGHFESRRGFTERPQDAQTPKMGGPWPRQRDDLQRVEREKKKAKGWPVREKGGPGPPKNEQTVAVGVVGVAVVWWLLFFVPSVFL